MLTSRYTALVCAHLLVLSLILGLFSVPASATITNKVFTITSNTLSLSIPYSGTPTSSNHQFNGNGVSVNIYDSSNVLYTSGYSWSINHTTHDISISFSSPWQGKVRLYGLFGASDTAASTDFQVTLGSAGPPIHVLRMCASCDTTNYARRTSSATGLTHTAIREVTFTHAISAVSDTVRVWMDNKNRVVFGMNDTNTANGASCTASGASGAVGHCVLQWGITAYPGGVAPLGRATHSDSQYADGSFSSLVDDRSW